MKIFLTGSQSFIGSVLWDMCLAAGHEVFGMDIVPPKRTGEVRVDLRDPNLEQHIPQGATIIHLAAISTDPLCKANPLDSLDVNITGTLKLAQAAARRGVAQFIFASTEWVYGDVRNDETQTEERPIDVTRMTSAYAFSKLAGERVLAFSGLANLTVLRFGIVYGPREKNWSAVESLLEKIRRGETLQVGSLKTGRRFIHVQDLCSGIMAAIGQTGHDTFNLAGDRLITLGEVIETSQKVVGKKVSVSETSPQNVSVRNPDSTKALRQLGWAPRVSFEDGIERLVQFLNQRATHV